MKKTLLLFIYIALSSCNSQEQSTDSNILSNYEFAGQWKLIIETDTMPSLIEKAPTDDKSYVFSNKDINLFFVKDKDGNLVSFVKGKEQIGNVKIIYKDSNELVFQEDSNGIRKYRLIKN